MQSFEGQHWHIFLGQLFKLILKYIKNYSTMLTPCFFPSLNGLNSWWMETASNLRSYKQVPVVFKFQIKRNNRRRPFLCVTSRKWPQVRSFGVTKPVLFQGLNRQKSRLMSIGFYGYYTSAHASKIKCECSYTGCNSVG